MAKRGKAARKKGLDFERDIAARFRAIGFTGARRQLEFQIEDANGVDLQGCDPYFVQCKKLRQYASVNTIQEVKCQRWLGEVPVLITAGDNQEPMAVLPLEDFIGLISNLRRFSK